MTDTALVPRTDPQVAYRAVGEREGVLLHLDSGQYHGVNATGKAIYELIDGQRDSAAIAEQLRERFGGAPQDVKGAVDGFLRELESRGLVSL